MTNDQLPISNEGNIINEEKEILKEERGLLEKLNENVLKMASAMEKARIDEYTSMLTRPWRFFFFNFVAGLVRGVGIAVGFTILAAGLIYILTTILRGMVDLPIIGQHIAELVKIVNQYLEQGPVR